ncbi:MAG: hypothetical protein KatS3mg050_0614 [Litorilinea sp.]|nr:MAG: hypothetical protein KatS3mg050_0614 [Litorilinea sp.]
MDEKRQEFAALLQECGQHYLDTAEGRAQAEAYRQSRQEAQRHFQEVQRLAEQGLDITEAVLLKLLPHPDTAANRWRGAWIHGSPAAMGDVRSRYEAAGWIQPEDWPQVAAAIYELVRRCVAEPAALADACQAFSALPYTKGFQAGMLSPILNALRPDAFLLWNSRVCQVLNYFTGASFTAALLDYPQANAALQTFIAAHQELLAQVHGRSAEPADTFDRFCHWLVTIRRFPLRAIRFWRIAAGDDFWQWQEWREGHYVAVGWDELGDLAGIDRREFQRRRDSLVAQYPQWTKRGADQAWRFARQLAEGDRVVVHVGGEVVLAIGTVAGAYYFVPDLPLGHRRPVEWHDLTPRAIHQPRWRDTLGELTEAEFLAIQEAPASQVDVAALFDREPPLEPPATPEFLRFCAPMVAALQARGGQGPAREVTEEVLDRMGLPADALAGGGARGGSRVKNQIHRARHTLVQAGLLTSPQRGLWQLTRQGQALTPTPQAIQAIYQELIYRRRREETLENESPAIRRLTESAGAYEVTPEPASTPPAVPREDARPQPAFSLADCAAATGLEEETLDRWVAAIERKGQAILYGPPGTGKTYTARMLARHLVGGGDGFVELVQFHPAYTYEDFVQGIRPRATPAGLDYALVPGRFLTFCRQAAHRQGRCVLIIDEINRAHLAQVFGELMYLLEYRNEEIALAAGNTRFCIPANVRIIGTMNTADRSIALVDHALRRRFAFLPLYPDYDMLRRYHARIQSDFPVEALVTLLQRLNREIHDPHFALGVTYFLRPNLADEIRDIWQLEVEPYLEEYFFDRPDRVDEFRWSRVRRELGL